VIVRRTTVKSFQTVLHSASVPLSLRYYRRANPHERPVERRGTLDVDRSDDLALTVYPNGGERDRRQHVHIRNTGDGELDIAGFTVRFDAGREHELQALGDARSIELLSYPTVHIRNVRSAESALTDGRTVTVFSADDGLVVETSY
jgi:hypothetical protein